MRNRYRFDDWPGAGFARRIGEVRGRRPTFHASKLVRQVLAQTTGSGRIWFSLLFALWSSSSATSGLIDTLNAIYDLKESRPWWKSRLLAVSLAIAMGILLTAALVIVVYGPNCCASSSPVWEFSYFGRLPMASRCITPYYPGASWSLPFCPGRSGTEMEMAASRKHRRGGNMAGRFSPVQAVCASL